MWRPPVSHFTAVQCSTGSQRPTLPLLLKTAALKVCQDASVGVSPMERHPDPGRVSLPRVGSDLSWDILNPSECSSCHTGREPCGGTLLCVKHKAQPPSWAHCVLSEGNSFIETHTHTHTPSHSRSHTHTHTHNHTHTTPHTHSHTVYGLILVA